MTPADLVLPLLAVTPGWSEQAKAAGLDAQAIAALLDEAARVAEDVAVPLGAKGDLVGAQVENGRVKMPEGHARTYAELGQMGWIAPDLPEALGGRDLPLAVQAALDFSFEGAAMPFMMCAGASRAAAHCLKTRAPDLAKVWAPKLASGAWAGTICISEPEAGSDVGRIRTKAVQERDTWRISGTKCWISFGDHDMAARIGHLCLARTGAPEEGTRGLSLFLVPNTTDDGADNHIHLERIEEKLGLHGSPACVLRFEGAEGQPIGEPGRGLPELFTAIELLRLQAACQGAGVAMRCCSLARAYAADRRQGGKPSEPPVPILRHDDVRRQLTAMEAETAVMTALVLDLAVTLGAARSGDAEAAARAALLLPIAKNFCGEGGHRVASGAVQVFGGAGYSRQWPVERYLRDTRVLTIHEGTTGIQARDFLMRRLLEDRGEALAAFAATGRAEMSDCPDPSACERATRILDRFEALAAHIAARDAAPALAADGYARAGWEAAGAIMACRLIATGAPLDTLGRHWLQAAPERFALAEAQSRLREEHLA